MRNFLKRLSLSQKMLLATGVCTLLVCYILYEFVRTKNEPISFAIQELKGNEYQRPIEKTFRAITKHRLATLRAVAGDRKSESEISSIQNDVAQGIQDLAQTDEKIGAVLQFTDEGLKQRKRENSRLSTIIQQWEEIKEKFGKIKIDEYDTLHTQMISNLRTMISHLGDTSNLVLDPDLDSYYLMDITLLALPQSQDRIQTVTVALEPIVRKGGVISFEDRMRAKVFASMMREADLERTKGDYQTSLNEDPNFYGKLETFITELTPAHNKFVSAYSTFIDIIESISNSDKLTVTADQFVLASSNALSEVFSYWEVAVANLDKLLENRLTMLVASKNKTMLYSIIANILLFIFGVLFSRSISRKFQSISDVLWNEANAVRESSIAIQASSEKLAEATTEQASALQETASAVEQTSAMVKKNAENADKSRQVSTSSQESVNQGKRAVEQLVEAIDEINGNNINIMKQIEESNSKITDIVRVIKEIGEKTKVINDIVFQTKLLSFNASVEAARAGEHGKGFAVVAEEVGNLAQMSGNAAKEIADMLGGSIQKVEGIVQETKSRVEKLIGAASHSVEAGKERAKRCDQALEDIVHKVSELNVMVGEISTASHEQAQGISGINKAMGQLDQVTHENAASSQKTSSISSNVAHQAEQLTHAMNELQSLVKGRRQNIQFMGGKAQSGVINNATHSPATPTSELVKLVKFQKPEHKGSISTDSPLPLKRAVGAEILPAENDPRFKDL